MSTDHGPTELEFRTGSAADLYRATGIPGCLPGVTRSETVPSMQRLYAVMLRIRRLNATFI